MVKDTSLSPIERYAKINQMLLNTYKQKCLDFKYDSMIKDLKDTSWNASAAEGGKYLHKIEFLFCSIYILVKKSEI